MFGSYGEKNNCPPLYKKPRVEVPEMISAEQRCFRAFASFRADSEHMKIISADQL